MKYTVYLKNLGQLHEAQGESVAEALTKLAVKNPKGMSILTLSRDGLEQQRIINNTQTQRLFSPNRITREVAIKNISIRFGV